MHRIVELVKKLVPYAPYISTLGIVLSIVAICIGSLLLLALAVIPTGLGLFGHGYTGGIKKGIEYLETIQDFVLYIPRERVILMDEHGEQELDDGFDPADIEEEEEYEEEEEEEEEKEY